MRLPIMLIFGLCMNFPALLHAMTVGEFMAAFEQSPDVSQPDPKQKEIALNFWSGSLEMALTFNENLKMVTGKKLFCIPKPWPSRKAFFDNFVQDAKKLAKDYGIEEAAKKDLNQIMLRGLVMRYQYCGNKK